ncbi:benzoate 4-monooxygenase cytochrome P450 [Metarhizium acridum CQMa 102]|uniref:Benzoate 4-monooxygenase cytochrome P450 n=1 Tax=Metarhizium acridum (strain CQMa 102) TaxID=655827 RepID=E9EAM5_METAQ|nr:benzoate 4-monooxygenase cytochrome P450 [Metarhizium acridum CQMa 102]EFY87025.1 benzoate 4-monooxygenase cytochrome P450 [Metarhizium acridum CQMa 102]
MHSQKQCIRLGRVVQLNYPRHCLRLLAGALRYLFSKKTLKVLEQKKIMRAKRMDSANGRDDLIEPVVKAKERAELTFDYVLAAVNGLIVAGAETTSLALSSFAYYMESLRIYPAAPIGFPRTIPKGVRTITGRYIPEDLESNFKLPLAKTIVLVNGFIITHLSEHFQKPFKLQKYRGTHICQKGGLAVLAMCSFYDSYAFKFVIHNQGRQ